MNLKSLLKDTAIYGLSSIVGRFLNYLLVPLYTTKIAAESGGYGIVTNLYAYTAFFLALLTFGMETTLFRFSNKDGEDANRVYGTTLRLVGGVALTFVVLVFAFVHPISAAMGYANHPEYVACMAAIVGLDAFQAIMFSRLRQQHKPIKFMILKFAFIIPNVLLNLFLFLVMPTMFSSFPALEQMFVRYDYGVGLIFFVNLLCTAMVTFGFWKELQGFRYKFDAALAKRLLKYTWPLLIFSLVGILNQVADKMIFPKLMPGDEGRVQLGIYGACVKVAMIMALLTQAFRYAYEPIVFSGSRDKNSPETLSEGMTYFVVFAVLAFLGVMFYMPILKFLVGSSYREGLAVVPVVMLAEIFMGIYFNLSFWYKLSDQTHWGAIMSAVGAGTMILVNILFVPRIGYWACAWGGFAGYGVAMLLCYFIGQKKYPIPYDMKSIGLFVALAALLYAASWAIGRLTGFGEILQMVINTILILPYLGLMYILLWKKRANSI
ncbi:MAG: lipopolysaccharide biosynthesis protein [Bacteroidales bacterium]|nr:lipopolysaccharide biosynthesis protein [Bacteroidales bacterium]